jgi:hypothetical protein
LFVFNYEQMNYHHSKEEEKTVSIAIIAIVAALGVLGVVIVLAVMTIPQQQAEAAPGCEKGLPQSAPAFNASQGRCFRP